MPWQAIEQRDTATIGRSFHAEHNRLYGYTLEAEGTPIELINVRLQAIGATEKRDHAEDPYHRADASHAAKAQAPNVHPRNRTPSKPRRSMTAIVFVMATGLPVRR